MMNLVRRNGRLWLTAGLVAACEPPSTDPMAETYGELPADQIMVDVVFNATREGIRVYHLVSDTAYVFADSSVMHLRGVDLEMYQDNGRLKATLVSERGTYDNETDAMVARGNVVLNVVTDSQVIRSAELHYDPQTRRVWSDSVTQRTIRGETLEFESFTADDEFRNVRLIGPRGRIGGRSGS